MPQPRLGRLSASTLGLAALLLFVLVSTLAAWTPSHYEQAARGLGLVGVKPVFGDSRPVRSDEWGVTTPYFQIAVASDLGPRDTVSPYHEPLKAFFALPSRDWSMAFKPDLWGFLALAPAHAFALHYALLAAAGLLGAYLLLRQLGCRGEAAAAASALLFFSQFVQVWWSSNAPVLGLAAWPAVVFLWRAPWWLRLPALAYVIAVWLIGQLYPPLIIATGLALGVAILAFRPEALRPGRVLTGAIATAAGIGIAWLHYADLVPVMMGTVYPGRRVAEGGGIHPLQLAAHLFPNLVTQRYEPIPLWPTNACEVAVAGSLLPLALACFGDHRALAAWAVQQRRGLMVWAAGLLAMLAWMLLPIPGRLAPILNLVPPLRLVWGFGLLLLIGLAVVASAQAFRLTRARVAVFLLAAAGAWAVSKLWLDKAPLEFDRFDLVVAPVLLGLLALRRFAPLALSPGRVVLGAIVLTSVVTFGGFNPVQSAKPIFSVQRSPALEAFRAYARANPKGWVVAPGLHASTLNGAGVPAVDHTLLQPQAAFFRAAYPDLDPATSRTLFNRYAHVMPALVWAPGLAQEDVVAIPPDPFAISLPVDAVSGAGGGPGNGAGAVEQATAVSLGSGRWGVIMGGWADWAGVSPDQRLRVALDAKAGRIVTATAFRLPRPNLVQQRGAPSLFAAGFGLRLVVEGSPDGPPAADQFHLQAVDRRGARTLAGAGAIGAARSPVVFWPAPPGG